MQAVFHDDSRILELIWRACPANNSLPTTLRRIMRLAPLHQPAGWLVNGYHMRAFTPADQQWLTTHLVPQLFEKHTSVPVAIVQPRSVLSQLTFNQILVRGHYPPGGRPRQFSSHAAAWHWLTTTPPAPAPAA